MMGQINDVRGFSSSCLKIKNSNYSQENVATSFIWRISTTCPFFVSPKRPSSIFDINTIFNLRPLLIKMSSGAVCKRHWCVNIVANVEP